MALVALGTLLGLFGCRGPEPRSDGVDNLKITDLGGYVEMVARQREQEQEPKRGAGRTRTEETIFEENLRLDAEGHVYHPNLLDFTLGGLFGLIQQEYEDVAGERKRHSTDHGSVVEFDFDAQILKRKRYPVRVFAHRHRGFSPRQFLPSLETTTTDYGAVWQYVSKKVPTSLQFRYSETEQTPLFVSGQTDVEGRQENSLLRFETAYNFSDYNALSLIYERESVEERPFEVEYDSDEVTLSHRLDFGERHRSRLDSDLNYLNQRGTFSIERTRWRETLRLQHSDTLRSLFRLEAIDRRRGSRSRNLPPIDERSLYFTGSLEHRLYESLTSQVLGFVQTQKFDPGLTIDRLGGELSLDYRKTNRWGVLYANYRLRLKRDDHQGDLQAAEIIDEPYTFEDPEPIVLRRSNVNTGSIIIRADDRVTFYQRGQDYTVRDFGNWVEIWRVPTGRIADGQAVLVDYIFNIGGTYELDTIAQNFGIREEFNFGLTPYYRLEWQDQTVSPQRTVGVIPEDITGHIVGVEFQKKSLRLTAEYEDHDSTIDPFEALRLAASYTHRFKSGATGSADVRWSDTDHEPPNERGVKVLTVRGRYRHPVTRHLNVEGAVLYRRGEDSLSGDDEGIDVLFSLEGVFRKTELKITLELGQFDDDFTRNDYSALYVQARRSF